MNALVLGSKGGDVEALHTQLAGLGYVGDIFDLTTDALVRAYQGDSGLGVDGVVGDLTQAALCADLEPRGVSGRFGGSYGLLIRCEGHVGKPYVPSASSGGTLGFGYDLRHQSAADLRRIFSGFWSEALLEELCGLIGLVGPAATAWLTEHGGAERWSFTAPAAGRVLPLCAARYWAAAVGELPSLLSFPARVQSAVLSATYSLWLTPLRAMRDALLARDWTRAAELLEQQGGWAVRRKREADLIRSA